MHRWDVSVAEATDIQKDLQRRVINAPLPVSISTIAGADVSFSRFSDHFHACVVVLSYPGLELLDHAFSSMTVTFPYVPGYLSFREVPAIAEAYKKLRTQPDVIVMDGHGIAHPRRIGVATHLGLVLDVPSVGCAKSKLFGVGDEPPADAGGMSPLTDPYSGEQLGVFLRTKRNIRPVIVSPGHRSDVDSAAALISSCVRGYRIPEPTRLAHILVNKYRKGEIPSPDAA